MGRAGLTSFTNPRRLRQRLVASAICRYTAFTSTEEASSDLQNASSFMMPVYYCTQQFQIYMYVAAWYAVSITAKWFGTSIYAFHI